jgi:hypothetical protein
MENTTRTVISKSSKKKTIKIGDINTKAQMEMVVYRTKESNGKKTSVTKHEIAKK